MTIPWPKDLPMNNRNLKAYGKMVKKLQSDFKNAKEADFLQWEGYKKHEPGDDCIMSPLCTCDDCRAENVKMD